MRKRDVKQERFLDDGSLGLLIMTWVYRPVLVLVLAAGIYCFSALPAQFTTSECTFVLLSGAVFIFVMQKVYHACEIGQNCVLELVVSQALACLIGLGMIYLAVALYTHLLFNPVPLLAVILIQILVSIVWTVVANKLYFARRRKPRTVVVCMNEQDVMNLRQTPHFDDKYDLYKIICNPGENIQALRKQLGECEVLFAVDMPSQLANSIAKLCLEKDIKGYFTPRLGHIIMAGAKHRANFTMPLFRVERAGGHSEYRVLKRFFDVVLSAAAIVALSPVMLLTALAIWLDDHGPVFYRQVRLTRDGQTFDILKFRSMKVDAEKDGVARLAEQNDSRITRVGRFIRAGRIDELPQLFNIFMGDMSIVGPRPERPEIAKQYEEVLPEFSLRLQVKAGLTGLAQVYGHYNTEPYYKLQMDLMYINEMSLLKDLRLILATIRILFVKERTQGIAQHQETALRSRSKSA